MQNYLSQILAFKNIKILIVEHTLVSVPCCSFPLFHLWATDHWTRYKPIQQTRTREDLTLPFIHFTAPCSHWCPRSGWEPWSLPWKVSLWAHRTCIKQISWAPGFWGFFPKESKKMLETMKHSKWVSQLSFEPMSIHTNSSLLFVWCLLIYLLGFKLACKCYSKSAEKQGRMGRQQQAFVSGYLL